MNIKRWAGLLVLVVSLLVPNRSTSADAAPPFDPPGGDISPEGQTEVEMVAERVEIDLRQTDDGTATVTAWFQLLNTGTVDESLQVRFPLNGDPQWISEEEQAYTLITDFKVWNGSQQLATQTIEDDNSDSVEYFLGYGKIIYWSVFEVDFPVGEQVELTVQYSLHLTSISSCHSHIFYILATGAGWKGPIRDAEIVLRFPYIINEMNVFSLGSIFSGADEVVIENELRLHLVDFEPDSGQNLLLTIMKPALWQNILSKRLGVISYPEDLSAWQSLARAYEEAGLEKHGWFYDDQMATAYTLAFLMAIDLDPDNLALHLELLNTLDDRYGYRNPPNYIQMVMLNEAATILQMDPGSQEVLDMLALWQKGFVLPTPVPPFTLLLPTPTREATQAYRPTFTPSRTTFPTATRTPQPVVTPLIPPSPSTPQEEASAGMFMYIGIALICLLAALVIGGVSFWIITKYQKNRQNK